MAKKKWTVSRAFPLMLIGAVVVGVIVVAAGSHLRRATVIAESTASLPAGALEGEPCAVLTKDEYNGLGILSSCMYELSGGQFLAMRLDLGKNYQQGMWIELASQWSKSADGALPTMLECNSKEAAGCAFYLE